ncbi:MAG: excinuclease ABC subunit B [Sphingobium sp.]|nr:excinuclease ABC subunit B [Sphingobium sp.]
MEAAATRGSMRRRVAYVTASASFARQARRRMTWRLVRRTVAPAAGAMGLGTNRQRTTPSKGWKPAKKPDLMTHERSRRGKRSS